MIKMSHKDCDAGDTPFHSKNKYCYKYNKPIRSTIFNFNKLVANLDIDTKTPDS